MTLTHSETRAGVTFRGTLAISRQHWDLDLYRDTTLHAADTIPITGTRGLDPEAMLRESVERMAQRFVPMGSLFHFFDPSRVTNPEARGIPEEQGSGHFYWRPDDYAALPLTEAEAAIRAQGFAPELVEIIK